MRGTLIIIGALVVLTGVVWILQGINVLPRLVYDRPDQMGLRRDGSGYDRGRSVMDHRVSPRRELASQYPSASLRGL